MKKLLSILLCVLLVCGTCCAALAEETEITFCVNIQPQLPLEFWQGIADRYMAAHPEVKVKIDGNPSSNVTLFEYQKTLLATDQFPDVMVMQNPADFVPSGALLPFEDGELDYLADPEVGKIGGKQYVANYKKQIIGVFYNKDLFAANGIEVPQTWDELVAASEKLLAAGIQPFSIGMKDGWPQAQLANMFAGTDLLAKDTHWGAKRNANEVKFNNEDLKKGMEKYQTICTKYAGDNLNGITYTQMLELFFTGKAAMLPIGSWVNAEVAKNLQDFEVGWFVIPGDDNANVVSVFVNEGLSIGANTKYPEVCKDFINFFFTDKETYSEFLKSEQLFATTKEPVEYEMIPLRKNMEEQIASMQEVEGFESMTGDDAFLPGLKDYFTNKTTQNIANGADIAAELDAMDAEWEIANEALEDAQ